MDNEIRQYQALSPPPLTLSHVEIQNKETHSLHIPYFLFHKKYR
jgi:hypothetical protein